MRNLNLTVKKLLRHFFRNPVGANFQIFKSDLKIFNQPPDFKFCAHNIVVALRESPDFQTEYQWLLSVMSDDQIASSVHALVERLERRCDYLKRVNASGSAIEDLKNEISGVSWEKAKQTVFRLTPASFLRDSSWIPDDEVAEESFRRIFRVSKFGTYTDLEFIRNTSVFRSCNGEKFVQRIGELSNLDRRCKCNHCMDRYRISDEILLSMGCNLDTQLPRKIRIYRGVSDPYAIIRHCDYVVQDRDHARDYVRGRFGVVISKEVLVEDLVISKMPFGSSAAEFIVLPKNVEDNIRRYGPEHYISYPHQSFAQLFLERNPSVFG